MSLKLSDTRVYEPQIRARLGTTAGSDSGVNLIPTFRRVLCAYRTVGNTQGCYCQLIQEVAPQLHNPRHFQNNDQSMSQLSSDSEGCSPKMCADKAGSSTTKTNDRFGGNHILKVLWVLRAPNISGHHKWFWIDPLGPLGFNSPNIAQRHALP